MAKQTHASDIAARVSALGLNTSPAAGGTPANPTAIGNTSLKMAGLAQAFTPSGSGQVLVIVTGTAATATAAQAITLGGRYGTGSAPANAAAVTGTRFGGATDQTLGPASAAAAGIGFALTAVLQLAPGVAYWFDLALATANAGDVVSASSVGMSIIELP